jgi:hypothetical protein
MSNARLMTTRREAATEREPRTCYQLLILLRTFVNLHSSTNTTHERQASTTSAWERAALNRNRRYARRVDRTSGIYSVVGLLLIATMSLLGIFNGVLFVLK